MYAIDVQRQISAFVCVYVYKHIYIENVLRVFDLFAGNSAGAGELILKIDVV